MSQLFGFGNVLRDTAPRCVADCQQYLGFGVSQVCRLLDVVDGFLSVLWDASSFEVGHSHGTESTRVLLFGCLLEPTESLLDIDVDSFTIAVAFGEFALGIGISLFGVSGQLFDGEFLHDGAAGFGGGRLRFGFAGSESRSKEADGKDDR